MAVGKRLFVVRCVCWGRFLKAWLFCFMLPEVSRYVCRFRLRYKLVGEVNGVLSLEFVVAVGAVVFDSEPVDVG